MTVDEANRVLADAELVADGAEVAAAIGRLATEIAERLGDCRPLVLCVMNGGLVFAGQLLPKLSFPLEVGYLHATRYGSETRGRELLWRVRPEAALNGRTVLLLDDILDEGVTLAGVVDYCRSEGADRVLTAVLVDKKHERKVAECSRADFTGLVAPDRFLFGCGLDYKGYWRNAPGIYAAKGV